MNQGDFLQRVQRLPWLGLGVSTEFGAGDAPGGLDLVALRAEHPEYASFLEVGVETAKGLDRHALAWRKQGLPTTYHFLDVNLDEPEDFDEAWLAELRSLAAVLQPAWLCGDAGLWHFGRRERGHMLLLPPILSRDSASEMAEGITRLRGLTGYEVLPENPPGSVFLGELHLLEYFARVCESGDTGFLLDCAHLAIYQHSQGFSTLTGLQDFPLDRIVEIHVAGGIPRHHEGYEYIEDDHSPVVLEETWEIFEHIAPRAPNLRAVVFECERNPLRDCLSGLERIARVTEPQFAARRVADA